MLFLYSYYENSWRAAICTIEQIVAKLEELQGEDRGRMGSTRMEEQELTAELAAVHILTNFCRDDVIKNEDAIGKKRRY